MKGGGREEEARKGVRDKVGIEEEGGREGGRERERERGREG